jgi:L-cystine transport system ATP-binding protein
LLSSERRQYSFCTAINAGVRQIIIIHEYLIMITLNKISKSFSGERVLKEVSLSIHSGEIICIIGPSGSGKTTLLRTLNFLEPADSGQIRIDDVALDCAKAGKRRLKNYGQKPLWFFNRGIFFITSPHCKILPKD